MTKLSHTLSYRLLKRWDHLCRLIPSLVTPRWEVWSDASGKGYGGHLGPQSKPIDVWQDSHPHLSSGKGSTEYVEALAVLLSLRRWSDQLRGKKVFCYVDNYQVYQVLKRRYRFPRITPPIPPSVSLSNTPPSGETSSLVVTVAAPSPGGRRSGYFTANPRCLKTQAAFDEIDSIIRENEIQLCARWVWGKDNTLADALSRLGRAPGRGEKKLTPHVIQLLEAGRKANQQVAEGDL
ncbi:hypothetical protein IAU60_003387 [Kwoniella sp. DSM 27419]